MSQPWIMKAVVKAVKELPGFADFRVLDLSCGDGELIGNLDALGCHVEGTHFIVGDYVIRQPRPILKKATIHENTNLHEKLPFADGSYDLVTMTEVLEHLDSHSNIVYEAGRILKEGGYFIFTTPNIYRLHSRLKFFLTGTHKLIRRRVSWDISPRENYEYHQNPVDFPMMHSLLYQAGLTVSHLRMTKFKLQHSYLFLLYPLIWLGCKLGREGKRDNPLNQAGETDLMNWMTHPAMLGSEQLLVVCRKSSRPVAS